MLEIPARYRLTKKVVLLLNEIDANRAVIDSIDISPELEKNIRRESIIGSALFSTRIEGNTLTRAEMWSFSDLSPKDQRKIEVANLCRVIEKQIADSGKSKKKINAATLLRWHRNSMKDILDGEYCGKFRKGHEGLFDAAGNLIYHAPPPSQVATLIKKLLVFSNTKKEKLCVVRAVLAHLALEKIHPFVDGNGRVGRLLQLAILCRNGYGMKGLTVVEEEVDNDRQSYYRAIEGSTSGDCQQFLELMLEFIRSASNKAKEGLIAKQKNQSSLDLLLPRQREIAQIISEHGMISFDSLHRRFFRVSPRQIAYDLGTLEKKGYIQRIGKTRGAMYKVRE